MQQIWIEVDDFVRSMEWALSPTGIQRVQMEIISRLIARPDQQVYLMRLGRQPGEYTVLSTADYRKLLSRFRRIEASSISGLIGTRTAQIGKYLAKRVRHATRSIRRPPAPPPEFQRGDIIVNFGASWEHPEYSKNIRLLKARFGVRFVLLLHDLLPVTHPDLVCPMHSPNFARWLDSMMLCWDAVLTPSRASATALGDYYVERGMAPPSITPIQFGHGFEATPKGPAATRNTGKPFVLFVSTLEVRKNHILLLDVWNRLIEKHGCTKVPDLVFVGKFGWQISDLKAEIARTKHLNGKLKIMNNLTRIIHQTPGISFRHAGSAGLTAEF